MHIFIQRAPAAIFLCTFLYRHYLQALLLLTDLYYRKIIYLKPFPKGNILDSFKLKEFADDNFNFDEKIRKFFERVENTVKRRLLVSSNFSFLHSVFKRLIQQTREKQGLFGKGLSLRRLSLLKTFLVPSSIGLFLSRNALQSLFLGGGGWGERSMGVDSHTFIIMF